MSANTLTIAQHRALDRAKEGLVRAAEKLLDDAAVTQISKNKLGDSQLRNLLAVANETESPAVVANFIRYQMGRDNKGTHWRHEAGGTTFGERFRHQLEDDGGAVQQALQAADLANLEGTERQLARIYLVRHFIGFASRYLKYLEPQRAK